MKIFQTFLFSLTCLSALPQADNQRFSRLAFVDSSNFLPSENLSEVKNLDLSSLWTKTPSHSIYGIIGDNKQRIRIKFLEVKKVTSFTYMVSGKTMVKDSICSFSGTITVRSVRFLKRMHWGADDEYKNAGIKQQAVMVCEYNLTENPNQADSGTFHGKIYSQWYIDKSGAIRYDDIENNSDGYSNNMFVGNWQSHKSKTSKVCNWGDHRVPFAGDFDTGAGEFSPDEKYLPFGWKNYSDAYVYGNVTARQEEERDWWK